MRALDIAIAAEESHLSGSPRVVQHQERESGSVAGCAPALNGLHI